MSGNNHTTVLAATTVATVCFIYFNRRRAVLVSNFMSEVIIPTMRTSISRRRYANYRRSRRRKSWTEFEQDLSERQFRRYFRMSRDIFQQMCCEIEDLVGEQCFKSEEYLCQLLEYNADPKNNIVHAHQQSTGGYISGEAKIAITMRVLGGGSFMDMALIFGISFNHAHKIVAYTVENWFLHPCFYPIDGIKYCCDDIQLQEVAKQFYDASQE